jgi:squalene synthase HpnC
MVNEHLAALIALPKAPPSFSEALALCVRLTKSHYENFTLISWLVPWRKRAHLCTLYAFCRTVDDVGDEAPGDREALLDRFEEELQAAYGGSPHHPVLVALQATIDQFDLPQEPFVRLIEANRIDQRKARYDTFPELLRYCGYSANPVGRLFLTLFGYREEACFELSDFTCTALQLTNFWQDIRRDFAQGRIYLPREEMAQFGVRERDLEAGVGNRAFRELLRFQVERTREYFRAGLPLIDLLDGHLKVAVALFSRGGLAILNKIEQGRFDTLRTRPRLSRKEKMGLFVASCLLRRRKRWSSP